MISRIFDNKNKIGSGSSVLAGWSPSAFGSLFTTGKPTSIGSVTAIRSWTRPLSVLAVIVLVIIIAIFIGVKWGKVDSSKPIVKGPVDLFAPKSPVILSRKTTATMGGTYTLAFYLRVDAAPDMRESTPLFTWPGVWSLDYNPAREELLWTFQQTQESEAILPNQFVLPGVPLQRWSQITMVFEGRSVDLFVNGSLVKSTILSNVPPSANASLTLIPGNLIGSLAFVQVWTSRLTTSAVSANFTATSDTQGRPLIATGVLASLQAIPNLFASDSCTTAKAPAPETHKWSFPYA